MMKKRKEIKIAPRKRKEKEYLFQAINFGNVVPPPRFRPLDV
jgi:hypothetical protein